jgi:hypothetical protein
MLNGKEFLYMRDEIDGYTISTVKAYRSDYYESMVFDNSKEGYEGFYQRRYSTRKDAIEGHNDIYFKVKDGYIFAD